MSLWKDLSRRRVLRVAGIYAVVAWIVAEAADVIFPALLLPDWTVRFVVALLVLGFPVAMVLAWAFDITKHGLERTVTDETVSGKRGPSQLLSYAALMLVGMAVLIGLVYPGGPGGAWQSLRTLVAGQPAQARVYTSIAVLPFANLGDTENAHFSAGISEEILNLLAKIRGLKVAARTSSFAWEDSDADIRTIARELGVETVLEGSVRRQNERIRITAQLIDASTGFHLWSNNYDEELADIFEVQDRISAEIVNALRLELQPIDESQTRVARYYNAEATELYWRGLGAWKRRTGPALLRSIELFDEAIDLEPTYAEAWAGKAAAWVVLPGYSDDVETERALGEAEVAAQQALSHDPTLSEAHAVIGLINDGRGDWIGARFSYENAIELKPNNATAHQWYSILLSNVGRLEEALNHAQQAAEQDRISPVIHLNLGNVLLSLNRNDEALAQFKLARELGAHDDGGWEALIAYREGRYEEAIDGLVQLGTKYGMTEEMVEGIFGAESPEACRAYFAEHEEARLLPEPLLFNLYIFTGLFDEAVELVPRLRQQNKLDDVVKMAWAPEGAGLRTHPKFPELADDIGLTEYWRHFGWPDGCGAGEDGRIVCQS